MGAWVEGELDFHGANIAQDLVLAHCHIEKAPNFMRMNLNGSLILSGSQLTQGINAHGAKIAGSVFLRTQGQNRFKSHGEIRILGATIGGDLSCNGAQLEASEGQYALSADRAKITGGVFLQTTEQHRFESHGAIRFLGATIGSNLACNGAQLKGLKGQYALNTDQAKITGDVFLSTQGQHRFESHGEICLLGIAIGGSLDCTGAQLKALEGQAALNADRAKIAGSIFLRNGFRGEGKLSFISMRLNGIFQLVRSAPSVIDLSHAHIGFLETQPSAWAEGLRLDGFVYDGFRESSWNSKEYLNWLKKQVSSDYGSKDNPQAFKPQPWQQLISVLRKMGHDDVASDIAIAFQQRRYEIGKVVGFVPKSLHKLFGWLAGYGYKPLRLLGWMLGVCLFSATMYFCAAYYGIFTPSDPLVFQNSAYEAACRSYNPDGTERIINNADKNGNTHNWYTCGALMGEYTTFSPIAYSLDVILPLVDLGQEKAWGVYIATPKANGIDELFGHWPINHVTRLLVWFEIIFGWVASLMLVAVLTGLTERDKP